MKKTICSFFAIAAFVITTQAQATAPTAPAKAPMTKEERAKQKAKQDQEFTDACNSAGVSPDQRAKIDAAFEDYNTKMKEFRKDPSNTPDLVKAKQKELGDARNEQYKLIMGKDGYKKYQETRKKQKEANDAAAAASAGATNM